MPTLTDMRGPDWIRVLRQAVERDGMKRVAAQLGRSKATVSHVLAGNYPASTKLIEERVRGVLMNKTLECPVLGEISTASCQDEQAKPFAATNPTRVQVWRACRNGCPNFKGRS